MNHVTSQTAAALKAAGFPQPVPEIGQFWYLGNNLKWVMSHDLDRPGHFNMSTIGSQFAASFAPGQQLEYMAFAPAAEDILAELSKRVHPDIVRLDISAYDGLRPNEVQGPKFFVYSFPRDRKRNSTFQTNLLEQLAAAYLEI